MSIRFSHFRHKLFAWKESALLWGWWPPQKSASRSSWRNLFLWKNLSLLWAKAAFVSSPCPFQTSGRPWHTIFFHFFLLDAAWVRSRAERPSVSYTKVTSKVTWTGHNLQSTKTNSNNKLAAATNSEQKGGDGKMKRMREPWDRTHWRGASNECGPTLRESQPARQTRSTGQMKRRDEGETQPTSNLRGCPKIKTCKVPRM